MGIAGVGVGGASSDNTGRPIAKLNTTIERTTAPKMTAHRTSASTLM